MKVFITLAFLLAAFTTTAQVKPYGAVQVSCFATTYYHDGSTEGFSTRYPFNLVCLFGDINLNNRLILSTGIETLAKKAGVDDHMQFMNDTGMVIGEASGVSFSFEYISIPLIAELNLLKKNGKVCAGPWIASRFCLLSEFRMDAEEVSDKRFDIFPVTYTRKESIAKNYRGLCLTGCAGIFIGYKGVKLSPCIQYDMTSFNRHADERFLMAGAALSAFVPFYKLKPIRFHKVKRPPVKEQEAF